MEGVPWGVRGGCGAGARGCGWRCGGERFDERPGRSARRLRRAMARVETLAGEAKHERANRLSDAPDPEPVLRNLRRLNHDLTAVGRAVMSAMPAQGRQHLGEPV